jgi:hypothetical protein
MLQPWSCSRCHVSAEIECLSGDDSGYCWDHIVQAHDSLSPDCRPAKLIVFDWRQKDITAN